MTGAKCLITKKSIMGRIQEVADWGAQWVINFGTLKQSWRMAPSPPLATAVNFAPLKFSPLEPLWGAHACALMVPYLSCWFTFFFLFFLSFPLFPLILFPLPFLSLHFSTPLVTRGAKAPKAPPPPIRLLFLYKRDCKCQSAMYWDVMKSDESYLPLWVSCITTLTHFLFVLLSQGFYQAVY